MMNAVHHRLAGDIVAKVVLADVFDAGFAPRYTPHYIPEPEPVASGTGRVPDGRKDPRAVSLRHAALNDFRARAFSRNVRGPVLLSASSNRSSFTSSRRRPTISPLRQLVNSSRRMMSACCDWHAEPCAYRSSTQWRRWI